MGIPMTQQSRHHVANEKLHCVRVNIEGTARLELVSLELAKHFNYLVIGRRGSLVVALAH